jgi:hypothetical protein
MNDFDRHREEEQNGMEFVAIFLLVLTGLFVGLLWLVW